MYYRDIYYGDNPFKDQLAASSLPLEGGEPDIMISTPDIERYADDKAEVETIIDNWILVNGSYEFYTAKQNKLIGW